MLRRALAVFLSSVLLVVLSPVVAHAAADPATGAAVAFTVDPAALVQLALAFVLPVLVGLVTKTVTSSAVKAWLLAGLTLATSLLVELGRALEAGSTFDVGAALFLALPAFVVSVATHYGLWKPTGVSARVQAVGSDDGASLGGYGSSTQITYDPDPPRHLAD
jgi:hypothetical protein